MKVGVNVMGLESLFGGSPKGVLDAIALADEKGVDFVLLSDHLGFARKAHQSRRETHKFPFVLEQPWFEPMAFLAAAAALTSRIRLATSVLVAPLRPALLLAKQIATLDVISGGRVTIGLGVGWQEEEFRAAGMEFRGRFGDLEHQIEAMRSLWGPPPACGKGRSFAFEDFYSLPLPAQGRDLPIILGLAPSERNLDRMARLAQGWTVAPADRHGLRENVEKLHSMLDRVGRNSGDFQVHVGQAAIRSSEGAWDRAAISKAISVSAGEGATAVNFMATDFCRSATELGDFFSLICEFRQ